MYTFAALQYGNILHPRPILTLSDDIKADSLNDLTKFQKSPYTLALWGTLWDCVYSVFKCYFVDEKLTCRAKAQVLSKS